MWDGHEVLVNGCGDRTAACVQATLVMITGCRANNRGKFTAAGYKDVQVLKVMAITFSELPSSKKRVG